MNYITDILGGKEVGHYFSSCFIQVHTPLFGPLFWLLSDKILNSSKAFLLRKHHTPKKKKKKFIFAKIGKYFFFLTEWRGEKIQGKAVLILDQHKKTLLERKAHSHLLNICL